MDYDAKKVMEEIEQQLISSMKRTLWSHKEDEKTKGFDWPQWQAMKLKQLEDYKMANKEIFENNTKGFNRWIYRHIKKQFREGAAKTNKEAIKNGIINSKDSQLSGTFFGLNHRKLDSLIKSTKSDMKDVKYATLRMANDEYRKIIFKAQFFANAGAGTVQQAIDMASNEFLSRGFNSIEYKNGSRHNIADYCDMAIRTANKRANLMGEGEMRKRLNNPLVYVSKHGGACDKCTPWEGRVYIDDVWSGGTDKDGKYPLLSTAINGGLFHPRCHHGTSTYYEGINDEPEEVTNAIHNHDTDEYTQYLQQQKKKYERLANGSVYAENIKQYQNKVNELQSQIESNYIDITKQYKKEREYKVENKNYFIDDKNNRYNVNNRDVILKPTKKEKEVAELLGKIYGGKVELVPVVLNPPGVKTPDFLINGIKFDLKEPTGKSKNTIYDLLKNKNKQADNFIIDIHKSGLSEEESIEQVQKIFYSKHRSWIQTIILIKDGNVLKILKRK